MKTPYIFILAVAVIGISGTVQALPVLPALDDPGAPKISITSPPNGATVSGEQVMISVRFRSDEGAPVTRVKVSLDGEFITERVYEDPIEQGDCSFMWDTVRTPGGEHRLDITVFSGDKVLGKPSCVVTVRNALDDRIPPKVTVVSPRDGQIVSGVVPITVRASDIGGREPFVRVYIDKSILAVGNHGPYTYDWDTTRHENGPHIIDVAATDEADNGARANPIRVIVRNPVKMVPLAIQPEERLPDLAERVPATKVERMTVPESLSASTVTPREEERNRDVMKEEYARTLPDPADIATERFEVRQMIAGTTPGAGSPALGQIPNIPAGEASAPSPVVTAPAQEAAPISTVSEPVEELMPASDLQAVDLPGPKANGGSDLAAPGVPAPDLSTPPEVAGSPVPAKPVEAQSASVSEPVGMPVLVARLPAMESMRPVRSSDGRLAAPVSIARLNAEKPRTVPQAAESKPARRYSVKPGDSVDRLARMFNVPAESIIALNSLEDPNLIRIGEQLLIPDTSQKAVQLAPAIAGAGGKHAWEQKTKSVLATVPQKSLELSIKIGSVRALVNDRPVMMDLPAYIRSGRTMVAETFITEILGLNTK